MRIMAKTSLLSFLLLSAFCLPANAEAERTIESARIQLKEAVELAIGEKIG